MIEVHFLANQLLILKNKNQYTLYFHFFPSRFNARPVASLAPAEPSLDDNCIVGMTESNLVQVEIREG